MDGQPKIDVSTLSPLGKVISWFFLIILALLLIAGFIGGLGWAIYSLTHDLPAGAASPYLGLYAAAVSSLLAFLFYHLSSKSKFPLRIVISGDMLCAYYNFNRQRYLNLSKLNNAYSTLAAVSKYTGDVYGLTLEDSQGNNLTLELKSFSEKSRARLHDPLYAALTRNHVVLDKRATEAWNNWFRFMGGSGDFMNDSPDEADISDR